jgi:hypothetical protein
MAEIFKIELKYSFVECSKNSIWNFRKLGSPENNVAEIFISLSGFVKVSIKSRAIL